MRVVMLSWEFPPKRVGGIAAALEGLAPAVASQDCIVDVITAGDAGGAPCEALSSNLTIHRVLVHVETHDFFDLLLYYALTKIQQVSSYIIILLSRQPRVPR